jgi:hypothetical protein
LLITGATGQEKCDGEGAPFHGCCSSTTS